MPTKTLIAGAIATGVVLFVALLWFGGRVLLLGFAATLAGVLLQSLGDALRRHSSLPYGWSLAAVVLLLVLVLFLAGAFFGTRLADQAAELRLALPGAFEEARQQLEQTSGGKRVLQQVSGSTNRGLAGGTVAGVISGLFRTTLGGLLDFLIVLIVGLFLAARPALYVRGLVRLFPPANRQRVTQVLSALETMLRRWLVGRFSVMTLNGVLTGLGLWLLGVPMPFLLGVVTGLLNFIPNLGPFLASVPALLLALTIGPSTALYVALLYIVVQNLEGFVLTPLVEQRTVSVPPAVVLMGQLLMGVLAGALGVLLATPLVATILVLVRMLYIEDRLGERQEA